MISGFFCLLNLLESKNMLIQRLFWRFFLPGCCHLPASGCQPCGERKGLINDQVYLDLVRGSDV